MIQFEQIFIFTKLEMKQLPFLYNRFEMSSLDMSFSFYFEYIAYALNLLSMFIIT